MLGNRVNDDQDLADFNMVSDLYGDWADRRNTTDAPLSAEERIGLLVVDFGIRHDMGGWDGLIEDLDEAAETADALRAVNLPELADAVRKANAVADWHGREKAFCAIEIDDIDLLYVAVARYLRRIAS
jgi:hypothetical protein